MQIARSSIAQPSIEYVVGVDGGGTGTRAVVARMDGIVLGQGRAGPSALGQGVAPAWAQLDHAIRAAFDEARLPLTPWSQCALCAGLSGATYKPWRDEFMQRNPGFAEIILETDSFAMLLGAHGTEPGAIIAAGTGSIGEALHRDGRRVRAGGWGFPVGDEGSGAWLGLRAVRHTQCAMDGREPVGSLATRIFAFCGNDRPALQDWCARAGQFAYAQLAPIVFEEELNDPVAADLLTGAASALELLAHAIDPDGDLPLAICGTVGQRLAERLSQRLSARVVPATQDAATGALHWMRRNVRQTA